VIAAVQKVLAEVRSTGKVFGVNAFVPRQIRNYVASSASFAIVGADVALLARGSKALVEQLITSDEAAHHVDRAR
jgi:4-hydroxy-2-oxoheptanedioate aldolase